MLVLFQYILVVRATDNSGNEVDPPMEIHVIVDDINDNAPECENEESVFELQEGEPVGKWCVWSWHNPFMEQISLRAASK